MTKFFKSVCPLPDYRLEILTGTGALIQFDFNTRLHTVRFSPLCDMTLFQKVYTDGSSLYFDSEGRHAVTITASEFMDLLIVNRSG